MDINELKQTNDEIAFNLESLKKQTVEFQESSRRLEATQTELKNLVATLDKTASALAGKPADEVKNSIDMMVKSVNAELQRGIGQIQPMSQELGNSISGMSSATSAISGQIKTIKQSSIAIYAAAALVFAIAAGGASAWYGYNKGLTKGAEVKLDALGVEVFAQDGQIIMVSKDKKERWVNAGALQGRSAVSISVMPKPGQK